MDQPIRLDFPIEETTLESPPTFADLNNENSRPEDSYWLEWQRPQGSESSDTPSPELFNNGYQQEYCDQQPYMQSYYPEEAQYYPMENVRDHSPVMEMQDQRYYNTRYSQDCAQSSIEMQGWNYSDCAFNTHEVPECKQYYDVHPSQTVNSFSSLL